MHRPWTGQSISPLEHPVCRIFCLSVEYTLLMTSKSPTVPHQRLNNCHVHACSAWEPAGWHSACPLRHSASRTVRTPAHLQTPQSNLSLFAQFPDPACFKEGAFLQCPLGQSSPTCMVIIINGETSKIMFPLQPGQPGPSCSVQRPWAQQKGRNCPEAVAKEPQCSDSTSSAWDIRRLVWWKFQHV